MKEVDEEEKDGKRKGNRGKVMTRGKIEKKQEREREREREREENISF